MLADKWRAALSEAFGRRVPRTWFASAVPSVEDEDFAEETCRHYPHFQASIYGDYERLEREPSDLDRFADDVATSLRTSLVSRVAAILTGFSRHGGPGDRFSRVRRRGPRGTTPGDRPLASGGLVASDGNPDGAAVRQESLRGRPGLAPNRPGGADIPDPFR